MMNDENRDPENPLGAKIVFTILIITAIVLLVNMVVKAAGTDPESYYICPQCNNNGKGDYPIFIDDETVNVNHSILHPVVCSQCNYYKVDNFTMSYMERCEGDCKQVAMVLYYNIFETDYIYECILCKYTKPYIPDIDTTPIPTSIPIPDTDPDPDPDNESDEIIITIDFDELREEVRLLKEELIENQNQLAIQQAENNNENTIYICTILALVFGSIIATGFLFHWRTEK